MPWWRQISTWKRLMPNNQWQWWERQLREYTAEGREDCELGLFDPPYPNSDDPQDQGANHAYESGWHGRRMQLGEKFKWRQ